MIRRSVRASAGSMFCLAVLCALLWPLAYAVFISFTPSELLEPPRDEWSLRWYRLFFSSPQWTSGLWNSLAVAAMTVLGSLLGGVGTALALVRYHFRGRRLLSFAILLPLFLPAVVLGMALLPFVRMLGLWGTRVSLCASHSLYSLPVVYAVVRAALEELDPDLECAAQGLGAGPVRTFLTITLPVLAPALLTGATMAFILSMNEFILALFLSTPAIETLPKVIWPNLRYTLTPLVAAASGVTLVLTLLGLGLLSKLLRLERLLGRGA